MMDHRERRTIRMRLYVANPRCHWCSRVTRWVSSPDGRLPDDAATLDHFRSRVDPLRGKVAGEPRYVLACHQCNQRRGDADAQRFLGCQPRKVSRSIVRQYSDSKPLRAAMGDLRQLQAEYTALLQDIAARLKNDEKVAA